MIHKNPSVYTGNPGMEIENFLNTDVATFTDCLRSFETQIDEESTVVNEEVWSRIEAAFLLSQDQCRHFEWDYADDHSIVDNARLRFQAATDPWFRRSWIAHRARVKPSGFPGDYKMLIGLYNEKSLVRGLGAYLDLCISNLPLAKAVRARMRTAKDFLETEISRRSGTVRILDIASGPCHEYVGWDLRPQKGEIHLTCLDNDQNALDFVRDEVGPLAPGIANINTIRYNALRTRSAKSNIGRFGRFDIIYSVGLCDYLTDQHLIGILNGWKDTLDADGVLYVAFKDGDRYDKTPYQWHLDWHFYQRSFDHCLRLFELAGFDLEKMDVLRDETGIMMNFSYRPDGEPKDARFDHGETRIRSSHLRKSQVLKNSTKRP